MTSCKRFRTESINFFVTPLPILYYTFSKVCFNSNSFFGFSFLILLSTSSQICSIEFKSGENDGHFTRSTPFSSNRFVTIWGLCFGSLSRCKTQFRPKFSFFLQIQINFFVKYHDKPLLSCSCR